MVTLYAQASNTFIISQTYQKWSDDIIVGNSGRLSSVYKLQDKTEYGLIKATLISSVSHFNFGVETSFRGLSPQKCPCGYETEFWAACVARQLTSGYLFDADNCIFRLKHMQKSCQIDYAINGILRVLTPEKLREIFEIR